MIWKDRESLLLFQPSPNFYINKMCREHQPSISTGHNLPYITNIDGKYYADIKFFCLPQSNELWVGQNCPFIFTENANL